MSENVPPSSSSSSIICKCCGAESRPSTMSLLDEPNFVSALKKLLEQLLPLIMVTNVGPVLVPMMQDLVQKVTREELDLLPQRFNAREERNEAHNAEPRKLALKFSDTVSSPVYTGKDIKGKEGNTISIYLVDAVGETVKTGVEASSNVEIMVVADKHTQTLPLLSNKYLSLKDGVAVLDNIRFRSGEKWTKKCEVKLAARILTSSQGSTVEDAETESFLLYDSRKKHNCKSQMPLISDLVWRLKWIRKEGKLHKHLREAKIETVEQLLVSANTDSQSLQQILKVSSGTFKAILDHAQKCEIPADRYIYHCTSCVGYTAVVFDRVGRVLGLVSHEDGRFVPADDLNEDAKVEARSMVKSAFAERKHLEPYCNNEASTSDLDDSFFQFAENTFADLARVPQMIDDPSTSNHADQDDEYDSLWLENPALSPANWDAILRMVPQCSGMAKGRWKRAAMFLKTMSKWKRIVARDEDTHAQKKQRCG